MPAIVSPSRIHSRALGSVRSELVEDHCHRAAHFVELSANGDWGGVRHSHTRILASPSRVHARALGSVRSEPVEDRGHGAAHFDELSANGDWGQNTAISAFLPQPPAFTHEPWAPFGLSLSRTIATRPRTSTSSVRTGDGEYASLRSDAAAWGPAQHAVRFPHRILRLHAHAEDGTAASTDGLRTSAHPTTAVVLEHPTLQQVKSP
jgi:hypothetical protein